MTAIELTDVNALFLHTPKTGGTWVHRAIKQAGIEHRQPRLPRVVSHKHPPLSAFAGRKYDMIFTAVRHPAAWLQSYWCYRVNNHWSICEPGRWHPWRELDMVRSDQFTTFVDEFFDRTTPGYISRFFEWYAGQYGAPVHVMRQEHLRDDLAVVLDRLGFEGRAVVDAHPENAKVSVVPRQSYMRRQVTRLLAQEKAAIERWYGGAT